MSAPITEAHRAIAEKLGDLLDIEQMTGPSPAEQAAQLIADSEAAAVQIAMIREYGNLCATNEGLAKERDQLRAERDWLKTWQDQAETNYVIGEPLAKKLRDTEAERDQIRNELAAERARLRKVAIAACKEAQIKPLVWYPKGSSMDPNDLGKINEQQVDACAAAIDAAMKEGAK